MRVCALISLAAASVTAFNSPTFRPRSTSKLFESHLLEGRTISGPLVPLNNFVLVKIEEADSVTAGGIILTNKAKLKKTEGAVISVGPGRTHPDTGKLFAMPVSPGEVVVYGKYDGTEVLYDDEKHTLIRDIDVLVSFVAGGEMSLDTVNVLNDSVLVQVDPTEAQETVGGLLIASSSSDAKVRPSTGKVVKVGPGKMAGSGDLMDMDVSLDDMVKFRDFAGNEVKIGDDEFSVVKMEDILAKY